MLEGGGGVATVQVAARDNATFHISENNQDDREYCCPCDNAYTSSKCDGLDENNEYCCHDCDNDYKVYLSSK